MAVLKNLQATRVNIKQFILFLFVFCGVYGRPVGAQSQPASNLEYRLPREEKQEKYLSDDDFSYERPGAPATFEPWEKFKRWLGNLLRGIFGAAPSGQTLLRIFYILASLIIIWAVVKLVMADMNLGFQKSRKVNSPDYRVNEENIHTIDFERELVAAREQSQWRLLIRLQYLYLLRQLSQNGLISIREGKTNHDYMYEIQDTELRGHLSSFSRIFEYTWYGHFEVSEEVLGEADRQFNHLQSSLAR